MAFKFPLPKATVERKRTIPKCLEGKMFNFNDVRDKDFVGEGAYGSVLTGTYKGTTIVVKKMLSQDETSRKLFVKEARFLQQLDSKYVAKFLAICERPLAIMMEYVHFSFVPFGMETSVSSLKDLLSVLHENYNFKAFEHLPLFAAGEISRAVDFLHMHGIAHRDLKTLNILVSNSHYRNSDDLPGIKEVFEMKPVTCKVVDFGESRSSKLQTATILQSQTSNIGRGTLLFMAPELVLNDVAVASQTDLISGDIWSLGMIFFCLLNLDMIFPFQFEMSNSNVAVDVALKRLLQDKRLPIESKEYQHLKENQLKPLKKLMLSCLQYEPDKRPTAAEVLKMYENLIKGGEVNEINQNELTIETEIQINYESATENLIQQDASSTEEVDRIVQNEPTIESEMPISYLLTTDKLTHQDTSSSEVSWVRSVSKVLGTPDFPVSIDINEDTNISTEVDVTECASMFASSKEPQEQHNGFPVFESGRKTIYSSKEAAEALLNPDINPKIVCESVPSRVQKNVSFIVNLNALNHQRDITADDNGSYKSGQGRKCYVFANFQKNATLCIDASSEDREVEPGEDKFILTKYSGKSTSCNSYHRAIIRLRQIGSFNYYQYALVQYFFEGQEHQFDVAYHGNSKHHAPYKQTAFSVREKLKDVLVQKSPAEAVKCVSRNEGGLLNNNISAMLPRNNKQAENFRQHNKKSNEEFPVSFASTKDVLADIMEMCKRNMNDSSKAFIWRVEGAPEPMCVIGTEQCFRDIERFCCNAPYGLNSILTIDPTFDLGDFCFTPTTYRNLAIVDSNTDVTKIQMGPALVHYRKKFSTYHYFTTSLVGIRPALSQMKSFGTDGESPLISACEKTWPFADSLRRVIHSKTNVRSHLLSYLPSDVTDELISQIYGKKEGQHHQEGLCDTKDKDTFQAILLSLEDQWNALEAPHRGQSCKQPFFHQWFSTNVSSYMRDSMLKDVRERNGIAGLFTTNASESLNAAIKRKVNFKASELSTFLLHMQQFYDDQEEKVRSGFIGEGDIKLSPLYDKFEMGEAYIHISHAKKLQHEKLFYATELVDGGQKPRKTQVLNQGHQEEQIPGLTIRHSFSVLQKASQILSKGHILPSFEKGSYHVVGSSLDAVPHYVKRVKDGEYKCDPDDPRNGCLAFKKDKICAHVVAAAKQTGDYDTLIVKFGKGNRHTSITDVAMHGIEEGKGKKSGPGRKRRSAAVETVTPVTEIFKQPLKMKIVKYNGNHIAIQPSNKDFCVELLEDHPRVYICAGCHLKFPRHVNGKPFGAPENMVLSHLEQGSKRLPSGILKIFEKKSKRYYHPVMTCIRAGNNGGNTNFTGDDVEIAAVIDRLEESHIKLLQMNLQMDLQ